MKIDQWLAGAVLVALAAQAFFASRGFEADINRYYSSRSRDDGNLRGGLPANQRT